MKKLFTILSAISFMLFALVSFSKNALEAYLSVQLIVNKNYGNSAYLINTQVCQTVLVVLAVVCLIFAIVETLREKKK